MQYLNKDGLTSFWNKAKQAFAAKTHSHSEYASKSHTHSQYASTNHTHSEYQTAEQVNAAIESYVSSLGNAEGGSY